MIDVNWSEIKPEKMNFEQPTAGGYIFRIVAAEDVEEKEYVKLLLDISEGKFAGRGLAYENSTGNPWQYYVLYRSYRDSAKNYFRAFLDDLEESNNNFTVKGFKNKAEEFRGLTVGGILREEEYLGTDKDTGAYVKKTRLRIHTTCSADAIRKGAYRVPNLKPLSDEDKQKLESGASDYTPFSNATSSVDVPF